MRWFILYIHRFPDRSTKLENIFLFLNQIICCGYSKNSLNEAVLFEHTKHIMFKSMAKKRKTIAAYLDLLYRGIFLNDFAERYAAG